MADTGNHCIRKITPDGMVVTFAGVGKVGYCDGFGSLARFCSPCSVCVDCGTGVLYTSEHGCNVIRTVVQVRVGGHAPASARCRSCGGAFVNIPLPLPLPLPARGSVGRCGIGGRAA